MAIDIQNSSNLRTVRKRLSVGFIFALIDDSQCLRVTSTENEPLVLLYNCTLHAGIASGRRKLFTVDIITFRP